MGAQTPRLPMLSVFLRFNQEPGTLCLPAESGTVVLLLTNAAYARGDLIYYVEMK